MKEYKVHTYYQMYRDEKLVCNDSTMLVMDNFTRAKSLFNGKVESLIIRKNAANNYSHIVLGAYVEVDDSDIRPLTFHIEIDEDKNDEDESGYWWREN